MVSEYPAGLSRQILEEVMRLDGDVLSYSRVEGPSAMWQAAVSVRGRRAGECDRGQWNQ